MNQSTTSYRWITSLFLFVWMLFLTTTFTDAWMPTSLPTTLSCCDRNVPHHQQRQQSRRYAQQAGSFFNHVPEENNSNDDDDTTNNKTNKNPLELSSSSFLNDNNDKPPSPLSADPFEDNLLKMIQKRKEPSLASQPSTINGLPTAGQGFGSPQKSQKKKNIKKPPKPYVGIGPQDTPPSTSDRRINDPTKPQYDDQGYTLYQNETTGQTSRVFEALVDYPCDFTIKIVGANEGAFVQDLVAVVADSCDVSPAQISHSVRTMGKWTSLTVHAPVQSAEMLYQLYENVDRDPRVRFKF